MAVETAGLRSGRRVRRIARTKSFWFDIRLRRRFRRLVTGDDGGHKHGDRSMILQLTVNGDVRVFDDVASVAALVAALGLDGRKVAVERNLEIVPRSAYQSTLLCDGDRIEIVHFIGGG
jgi:sulfur carrier protein